MSLSTLIFVSCGSDKNENNTTNTDDNISESENNTTENTNLITHNGTTYGFVISPYTNKVWLDRNLGAVRVCEQFDDSACYGDYYQWGRGLDGHQDSTSSTTTALTGDVNSVGIEFIANGTEPRDWTSIDDTGSTRTVNWSKTDGFSVCPTGFRVPTLAELQAELLDADSAQISNRGDAYASFLKFPSAGVRGSSSGTMDDVGSWGAVWTNSVDGTSSYGVYFDSSITGWSNVYRAAGLSVRCLRD